MIDYELVMRWIQDVCEDDELTAEDQFQQIAEYIEANR
jgi:hypothetical protein